MYVQGNKRKPIGNNFHKLHGTLQQRCSRCGMQPISEHDTYLHLSHVSVSVSVRTLRVIICRGWGQGRICSTDTSSFFFVERSTLSIVFRLQCDRLHNERSLNESNLMLVLFYFCLYLLFCAYFDFWWLGFNVRAPYYVLYYQALQKFKYFSAEFIGQRVKYALTSNINCFVLNKASSALPENTTDYLLQYLQQP